jgi:hypothetical protein
MEEMMRVAMMVCSVSLLVAVSSCRSNGPESEATSAVATTSPAKRGNEQTDTPGDEGRFPPGASTPLRPAPMIQIQPSDLTTSIDKSPLRIGVDNLGTPVGPAILQAVAREARLYEWPEMNEVQFSVTTHDVTQTHAPSGYKSGEFAYVEITPASALADRWYAITLSSLPSGVTLPRYAQHETLPGGAIGARFSPGSHPTVSAIRVCEKAGGQKVVMTDLSERVTVDANASNLFGMGVASQSAAKAPTCIFDAPVSSGVTSAKFIRYTCQGLALDSMPMKMSFHRNIKSAAGRGLELPGKGAGPLEHTLSAATLTDRGDGCQIARPW